VSAADQRPDQAEVARRLAHDLGRLQLRRAQSTPRDAHPVADVVLLAYAGDVVEQAHATLALAAAGVGRPSYANARAAFEAALDMLLLVSDPIETDRLACLAYMLEWVETEELFGRFGRADAAVPIVTRPLPGAAQTDEIVRILAEGFELRAPGHRALIEAAYAEARRPKRTRRHWSDLGRGQIAGTVGARLPALEGFAEISDLLYGLASFHTHPRVRTETMPPTWVRMPVRNQESDDATHAMGLAHQAVRYAIAVLDERAGLPSIPRPGR
jgi:hypothetical protein